MQEERSASVRIATARLGGTINCIPILILINDLLQHMLQKYAERVGGYIENLSLRLKIRNGLAETSVIGPIKSVGSQARPGPARPGR